MTLPDWRASAVQRVVDHHRPDPPKNRRRTPLSDLGQSSVFGKRLVRTHLFTTVEATALLDKAAQIAGVNRSTFIRRAVAVQVAHFLHMRIEDVLHHSPSAGPYGGHQFDRGQRDDARGMDAWCRCEEADG